MPGRGGEGVPFTAPTGGVGPGAPDAASQSEPQRATTPKGSDYQSSTMLVLRVVTYFSK